ncbi:Zinc finger, RING/FYVE/PHD-type [Corchorus capsularis]|uniref:Zinc finger, RING/FYVE/PHD-type n=1 Tax=Corchorus capsularis TaxID=210143 RepID=A0A1R3J5U3_COCAP|nr:Zinc finger, RING/FYVE/PHD-type [Corchorus capsularis]
METQHFLMEKLMESEPNHPQMAGAYEGSLSSCAVAECQGKVMRDERGEDILPCNCGFKICGKCYSEKNAESRDGGKYPNCNKPYKKKDSDGKAGDSSDQKNGKTDPSAGGNGKDKGT